MKNDEDVVQADRNPLFTPTEAAVLTGLPLKAVNNAIDKRTAAARSERGSRRSARLVDAQTLMSLALERRFAASLSPGMRREVAEAAARAPASRRALSFCGGSLTIDLGGPRRELAASLREMRRARRLVVSDPDILGGEPVFRGSRVPVHLVATMLRDGAAPANVREGYPRLTAEMVRLAPVYAAAYPLRGRRRAQPWRDKLPIRVARSELSAVGAG